jgi:hypothetical protein
MRLQTGDVRTSIGSGLMQLGIASKAAVGIYAINSRGENYHSSLQKPASALPHPPRPFFLFLSKPSPFTPRRHTSAEWVLVDCALHAYNMVSVPLYDTLGHDAVEYICNHAELSAVACSAAVLPVLMQAVVRCPTVKTLVSMAGSGGVDPCSSLFLSLSLSLSFSPTLTPSPSFSRSFYLTHTLSHSIYECRRLCGGSPTAASRRPPPAPTSAS